MIERRNRKTNIERELNMVDIKDLHDGMKRVDVEAQVVEQGDPREVK